MHTQVTSFPVGVHIQGLEWVAGVWSEPRPAFSGVVTHLFQGAGCQALVVWGNAVFTLAGKFDKLPKQNQTKPQHNFVPHFLLYMSRKEWAQA